MVAGAEKANSIILQKVIIKANRMHAVSLEVNGATNLFASIVLLFKNCMI